MSYFRYLSPYPEYLDGCISLSGVFECLYSGIAAFSGCIGMVVFEDCGVFWVHWDGCIRGLRPFLGAVGWLYSKIAAFLGALGWLYSKIAAFSGCIGMVVFGDCGLFWVHLDGCVRRLRPFLGALRWSYSGIAAFSGCIRMVVGDCGLFWVSPQ